MVLQNAILTDLLSKTPYFGPHWTQTLVTSHIYWESVHFFTGERVCEERHVWYIAFLDFGKKPGKSILVSLL